MFNLHRLYFYILTKNAPLADHIDLMQTCEHKAEWSENSRRSEMRLKQEAPALTRAEQRMHSAPSPANSATQSL